MIYYQEGDILIRTAIESDIRPIADAIRREDAEEVLAEGCASAEEALALSFAASTLRLTLEHKGVPVALFGLAPDALGGSSARVWLLGAEGLGQIKKSFARLSRQVVGMFLLRYPRLWNRVDLRYTGAVKWLAWLGAENYGAPEFVGQDRIPFQLFIIRRA